METGKGMENGNSGKVNEEPMNSGDVIRKQANKKKKEKAVKIFSDVLMKSFMPHHIILMLLGRCPVNQKRKGPSDYVFKSNLCSFSGIYFIFTTVMLYYTLLAGTWNAIVIVMDINYVSLLQGRELLFEKIVLERHLATFIGIWTSLIHSCIASVNILVKRKYMANYLGFWTRAVDIMHMDVARGVFTHSFLIILSFLLMIAGLVVLSVFRIGPSTVGGKSFTDFRPTIMFMLMFRHSINYPWINEDQLVPEIGISLRTLFQIAGGISFVYVFISSKIYIFLFLFKCKLLRNAFANWNGRVYAAVLRGEDFIQNDRGRTTYNLLFKDHCVLLDLMEGTDRLFSTIIESYFGLQVVSICFEGYFFIRTAKWSDKRNTAAEEKDFFIRPYDFVPGLIILLQSVFILIIVAKAAAEVGEEAMAGLEIIRRKTMVGRRTDEELYFMLSMLSSYTSYKKLQLSGGGYFYLDKEFIIGISSTIFSYFIITYQFQPTLDHKPKHNEITRCEIGKFLEGLEHLPQYHWLEEGLRLPCPALATG